MGRSIGIISGKGGVGKTVSTANIGLSLHEFGHDVTLIDADVTAANLGLHLGFYSSPHAIQSIVQGNQDLSSAIHIHSTGIKIIPAALASPKGALTVRELHKLFSGLEGLVLVDGPPGLGEDALSVIQACDELLIVTNPEFPALVDALKVIKIAREYQKPIFGIVLNRVRGDQYELTSKEIERATGVRIVGCVRDDARVRKSVFLNQPLLSLMPSTPVSQDFKRIAANLTQREYNPPFFEKVRSFLSV